MREVDHETIRDACTANLRSKIPDAASLALLCDCASERIVDSLSADMPIEAERSPREKEEYRKAIVLGVRSCAEDLGLSIAQGQPPPEAKPASASAPARALPSVVRVAARSAPEADILMGSGFYCASNFIATNHHVVGDSTFAVIGIEGSTPFRADVVYRDRELDFAILKSPVEGDPLPFRDTPIRDGEVVYALGYPQGRERIAISSGTIKVISEEIIVHDALIAAGSSGGPLTDADGNVLGVVTFVAKNKGDRANESDRGVAVKLSVILKGMAARLDR